MDAGTLTDLVDRRWSLLRDLLQLGARQREAVDQGRMSELMEILRRKQSPLEQLNQLSNRLRDAIGDDPERRTWASPEARARCRARHEESEQMLQELLRQEAECEAALSGSRNRLQEQLLRSEGARRATSGYADTSPAAGSRLNLLSD